MTELSQESGIESKAHVNFLHLIKLREKTFHKMERMKRVKHLSKSKIQRKSEVDIYWTVNSNREIGSNNQMIKQQYR